MLAEEVSNIRSLEMCHEVPLASSAHRASQRTATLPVTLAVPFQSPCHLRNQRHLVARMSPPTTSWPSRWLTPLISTSVLALSAAVAMARACTENISVSSERKGVTKHGE